MNIRQARESDLPFIAMLHITSWREAYAHILPEGYLGGTVVHDLSARWAALDPGEIVFVAQEGEVLQGFAACQVAREGGPLLDNLHVARAVQKRGIGRALMGAVASQLQERGQDSLSLEVLSENHAARAAYQRLGGVEGPERAVQLYGQTVREVPVHWTTLGPLLPQ